MSSLQCYTDANETCQQKCLDSCCGHKPNNTASYYTGHSVASSQSTALYGQIYCTDHTMTKPNMSQYSSYDQPYNQHMGKPNMSPNAYGQTYGHHVTDHVTAAKPDMGGNQYCMGQAQYDHGHVQATQEYFYGSSRGMASCHGKSEMKGDCHKKKNKSLIKKKYKDCNRSCGHMSSDGDSD